MQEKTWSLYILECQDGSFYTGISPDPQKRFEAHCSGKGASYTRTHEPKALLMVEEIGTYSQALRREWQVKRLSKAGKLEFIKDPAALARPAEDAKICLSGRKKGRQRKKGLASRK